MHILNFMGQLTFHEDEESAYRKLIEKSDGVELYTNVELSPDIVTACTNASKPFTLWDKNEQVRTLANMLSKQVDLREHAANHVIAELESITDTTPHDIRPNDSDNHQYVLRRIVENKLEKFDDDISDSVADSLEAELIDHTADIWDDVSDSIGSPVRASEGERRQQIGRVRRKYDVDT